MEGAVDSIPKVAAEEVRGGLRQSRETAETDAVVLKVGVVESDE